MMISEADKNYIEQTFGELENIIRDSRKLLEKKDARVLAEKFANSGKHIREVLEICESYTGVFVFA